MGATKLQDRVRDKIHVFERMRDAELKKANKYRLITKGYVSTYRHKAELFQETINLLKILYKSCDQNH
jgi:hypothetical protein